MDPKVQGRRIPVVLAGAAIAVAVLAVIAGRDRIVERWWLWKGFAKGEARFSGRLLAGETFRRDFGPGLRFLLRPSESGWHISVQDAREACDPAGSPALTALTRPLRATNHCDLEGWHFRNSDNTGPNGPGPKNVNAPGEVREFFFSPITPKLIESKWRKWTPEDFETIESHGRGRLEVLDHRLDPPLAGTRARFLEIEFAVTLRWEIPLADL